jgi:anhydro-N-acetylmuramic acid kinase
MTERRLLNALGLMSGTSLDGIDAALVRSDGERVDSLGPSLTVSYPDGFRDRLRAMLGNDPEAGDGPAVAEEVTRRHGDAVAELLAANGLSAADIDVVGFHGHTVRHNPAQGITTQIGDGALLAEITGIPVVADFRSRDVAAGGEGAPLASLLHVALAADLEKPLAVLNLGGVANLTWIGDGDPIAFDTGPGNALIDDWMRRTTGLAMDDGGRLAASGRVDTEVLAALLDHPYFERLPPKSLDRDHFTLDAVADLAPADGAATLVAFTAGAVARAQVFLPQPPGRWLVSGGGRHNGALMAALGAELMVPVEPVEAAGWRGDAIEAQAFAFLAVRSVYGLALSLPTTTGVPHPVAGGTLHAAPGNAAPA